MKINLKKFLLNAAILGTFALSGPLYASDGLPAPEPGDEPGDMGGILRPLSVMIDQPGMVFKTAQEAFCRQGVQGIMGCNPTQLISVSGLRGITVRSCAGLVCGKGEAIDKAIYALCGDYKDPNGTSFMKSGCGTNLQAGPHGAKIKEYEDSKQKLGPVRVAAQARIDFLKDTADAAGRLGKKIVNKVKELIRGKQPEDEAAAQNPARKASKTPATIKVVRRSRTSSMADTQAAVGQVQEELGRARVEAGQRPNKPLPPTPEEPNSNN